MTYTRTLANLQQLRILDTSHALGQLQLESLHDSTRFMNNIPFIVHFLLGGMQFLTQIIDRQLKLIVGGVILLQFHVHLLNLLGHGEDLVLARLNLVLELLDFVVENKFELFQFLVLLLEIVNALLLVLDGTIALFDL